ncbi:MAG: phospho-sugar mutase [Cryomorphaceae bacterium]|nr:phospho-sugar mutase [Cryomorphaceae bacterium]
MEKTTPNAEERAHAWLKPFFDAQTRAEVEILLDGDADLLQDAFNCDLEFGTGGLRGKMGAGTNRVNAYTIRLATKGFSNYLRHIFGDGDFSVAIAYDSRNNSRLFAMNAAGVLAYDGFNVYVFEDMRPTPELSFAVRNLGCKGGIVVTASHNPPEYNGYKVYWEDGAQVLDPHDTGIIDEVRKVKIEEVKFDEQSERIKFIAGEIDEAYIEAVLQNCIEPAAIRRQAKLPMVYTSLHGTGITLLPEVLKRLGFTNLHIESSQAIPDGSFSTVESPNPEETEALSRAIQLAKETGAALVLGTDPDADRVGIAIPQDGGFRLLNGNETGAMLTHYQLSRLKANGRLPENGFVALTIVTSDLIRRIGVGFGLPVYETLTGFKYIAGVIREKEGKEKFVTGGEESYGYMIGDFVRDKDGIAASAMICEMFAWLKDNNLDAADYLEQIHREYGAFQETLISMKREGLKGKEEIDAMISSFRLNPPQAIDGVEVEYVIDYKAKTKKNIVSGTEEMINLPSSNVVQYVLRDGSCITGRPSGTEPKVKFYISVRSEVGADYSATVKSLKERIIRITKELDLN